MHVCLHVKSHYSLGYGTASVEDLVRRSAELGYAALALTDVENLYGQVRFHHAARLYGVKAITGVELRAGYAPGTLGQKARRLVLLARDREGYESLCRIITRRRGSIEPRDDDPVRCLDAQPRRVFFLSDDESVLRDLLRLGVPPGDVRFLLIRPGGTAPAAGISAVADPDAALGSPSDQDLHRLLVAIRRKEVVAHVTDAEPLERCLPEAGLLCGLFRDVPDALAETVRVADACTLDLCTPLSARATLGNSAGDDPSDRLENVCRQRFQQGRDEGRWHGSGYAERLAAELAVLRRLGFGAYFLTVAEITDRAREEKIPVAGRGSAAGSLVAHVLGITPVDPLKYGLYFERFAHPDRKDLPDIDLDLPSDRRDALIDWVFQRFGTERVAMVGAHVTFGRRTAYRAGLKALGMTQAEVDRFGDRIPEEHLSNTVAPVPVHLLPQRYLAAAPLIERLVGKPQHISVHPGGIVVAEPRIEDFAPLERAPKGVLVTQYDLRSVAQIGLVKIDLLGNRALTAVEEIRRWVGDVGEMRDGDPATLATLREGQTVGCFQIETPALRSVLRKLPVRGITDLAAALAIVRPGPASGEAKAAFIRRANGEEPPTPPHPGLEERLRATYGMMLYEEDLMAAIALLTGLPLGQADAMRAALLAADEPAEIERLRQEFLTLSGSAGVPADEAVAFWEVLARFVAYSFNKAHAIGYAHLAWQSAWMKTHHPVPFACAVLNSYGGNYPLRTLAADFSRHGVKLLAPQVNSSGEVCTVESTGVRIGLSMIKGLTKKSRDALYARRPFGDLRDLLERAPLGYRQLETLVLSGACDGLDPLQPECYPVAHEDLLDRLKRDPGVAALAGFVVRRPGGAHGELYRTLVRIRNELNLLGMHITDHPLRVLRREATRAGCIRIDELAGRSNRVVRVAAIVASARRLEARGGRLMQFVTLEDETGLVEAILFPQQYESLADPVNNPGPFLVSGQVAEDHGDVSLIVLDVTPFHERPQPFGQSIEPRS